MSGFLDDEEEFDEEIEEEEELEERDEPRATFSGGFLAESCTTLERRQGMNGLKAVARDVKQGVAIHGAGKVAEALVETVKAGLGDKYPAFLLTPLGEALAPVIIPAVLEWAATEFPRQIPQSVLVAKVAGFAIQSEIGGLVELLAANTTPILEQVAALAALVPDSALGIEK